MPKFQFPRIPRKFSAALLSYGQNSLLWAGLTILVLANAYAKVNLAPPYTRELTQVLQNPFTSLAHEFFAHRLWQEGLISQAQTELRLANVLGASTEDELTAWASEPARVQAAYDYWKSIVAAKPDYRDAYLSLATAAYQLGKTEEAKSGAQQVLALDPANVDGQRVVNLLGK